MSIYQIDRVQHIESSDNLVLFEFFLVRDISAFIEEFEKEPNILEMDYIEKNYLKKLNILYNLSYKYNTHFLIIIYDYNSEKILYLKRGLDKNKLNHYIINFKEFKEKFIELNNKNGKSGGSKKLGAVKENNEDKFTLNILKTLGSGITTDDNGLALTKKTLGGLSTRGFDFDLFQYIKSTEETIIYEFLKNESPYTTNYTANPMRYCWNGKNTDNRKKFIGLWAARKKLNGRLFLINYSDNTEEGIGISEVVNLDAEKGIEEEYKYKLSYNEFISWISDMNKYKSKDKDYLIKYNHKKKHYEKDFFSNWDKEKKNYGK